MAKSYLHSGVGGRIASVGAMAVTLLLGISYLVTVGPAQAQKKPAEKKPAAQPSNEPQNAWVKLCNKGPVTAKHKDGKEEKKELNVCMTKHERLDVNSGLTIIAASLIQMKIDAEEKNAFRLELPLGMALPPGVAVSFFPKDIWAKLEKKEKLGKDEEAKVKNLKFPYLFCAGAPPGCTVEVEANAELLSAIKGSAGFLVQAVQMPGTGVGLGVPLAGFNETFAGAPTDTKKYADARKQMFEEIAARRQQMLQEIKKQQEDLSKMQPNVGPQQAPAAKDQKKK